ncbi:adenosylcobinamide-GDP ribazoletransferase [Streptomyces sp. NPDC051940]|uniref:adenosylcobinamide-GDP ribazoletransferase n=1 Tax=Streptomyces sp. NPDC051940 TaxID=3155675 RepID=UPI00341E3C38
MPDALRFAFGTLTALPVRVHRWDRDAARAGMRAAPLVGLILGLFASAVSGALALGTGPLPAAVAAIAVPAALTRGLHLDGLADTADGLGSAKPPAEALAVMKRSDIGPFGVLTLVFTVLAQVAAVTTLYDENGWPHAALGLTTALVCGRLSLVLACSPSIPPARPDGLGAAVAGTVPQRGAWALTATTTATLAAASWTLDGPAAALTTTASVALGLTASNLLLRHCVRRLGGTTGDVFGALTETATTTTLLCLAFT